MMRRKLLTTILLMTFLLSGCTIVKDSDTNYEQMVYNVINSNSKTTNSISIGYKYYTPQGVILVEDQEQNQKFLIDGQAVYLYVDIISYYYQKSLNYQNIDQVYYYQPITHNDKNGYIKIVKEDDKYLLELVYNYGKIQTKVLPHQLNNVIMLTTAILDSIDYNDVVVSSIVNSNYFDSKEQQYNLNTPKSKEDSFLEYYEEYSTYEDTNNELPDDKSINNESEE